jgi:uncharacterized protein YifN (PemK superfamily)
MAIQYAPAPGTIVLCDFGPNSIEPEMTKRRPAIVLSSVSNRLCIVVPLSTTQPKTIMPWHYLLSIPMPLPYPYNAQEHWVKCDIINTVSFNRLQIPYKGKDRDGRRIYDLKVVSHSEMQKILSCVQAAIFHHIAP